MLIETLSILKKNRKQIITVLFLDIIFIFLYFYNLTKFPYIWTDEGWFSSPAIDLIKNGTFKTLILRGNFALEDFTFWQPPIYILLLALSFYLFGISIFSARLVSVVLALIGNNVLYKICSEYLKKPTALFLTLIYGTVPFFFIAARQVRMDIGASTFSLLSFYSLFIKYFRNNDQKKVRYLMISGFFSTLGFLCHLVGAIFTFLSIIGILFYNIPFQLNFLFSRQVFSICKEKIKPIIIFISIIILTISPYLIIILLYFNTFYLQYSTNVETTILFGFWYNISREYKRYHNLIKPYYILWSRILPNSIFLIILILIVFLFLTGIIRVFFMGIKKNHNESKILLIFIFGSFILYALLLRNKWSLYLCSASPYYFLCISFLFKTEELDIINFNFIKREILRKFLKKLNRKYFGYYKKIWIFLFSLINITTLLFYLKQSSDVNPYKIRDVFEEYSISKEEVLVGESAYYITLHDYNFLGYRAIWHRHMGGESFEAIIDDYNPKVFLYDESWRTHFDREFVRECELYFKKECRLVIIFNSSIYQYDPIYLYIKT